MQDVGDDLAIYVVNLPPEVSTLPCLVDIILVKAEV